jgi:hypothetical protein
MPCRTVKKIRDNFFIQPHGEASRQHSLANQGNARALRRHDGEDIAAFARQRLVRPACGTWLIAVHGRCQRFTPVDFLLKSL